MRDPSLVPVRMPMPITTRHARYASRIVRFRSATAAGKSPIQPIGHPCQTQPSGGTANTTPAPAGAWAPGELSIQLPLSGSIELATPQEPQFRRITKRHLLIVCPGSWSPRTTTTSRNHLAIGVGLPLDIREFTTPANTRGTVIASTTFMPSVGPLQALVDAAIQCAGTHANPHILHGLPLALLPALATALIAPHGNLVARLESRLRSVCHLAVSRDALAAHLGVSTII